MRKPRFIAFHVGEGAVRGDVDTRNASRPGVFKHVAAALVVFVTVVALAVPTAYAVTATNSASSSDDSTIQVDSSSSSDADATDNSTSIEDVESAENVASTGDADSADNADATVDDSADSTADDSISDSSVVANEDGISTYSASVSSSDSEDTDEIHVSVVVPSGAFTEDVSLSVSLVDDDAIVDELESSEISGDSYLGLDISFVNTDGVEIEPSESVDVTINVPGSVLGDDVDTSSLSVLHFVEDENGNVNSVDTVADTSDETDGTVTVDSSASTLSADSDDSDISNATVTAEFSVDSFSTFTITWSRYFEVTIHYVDQNGNEINGTQTSKISVNGVSDDTDKTYYFSEYAGGISGYTYSAAHYENYEGAEVTSMVFSQKTEEGLFWDTTCRILTFYNEKKQIAQLDHHSWSFSETKADVYLVYDKDDDTNSGDGDNSGDDTATKNATVTANKTAELNDDGTYDLTLSISGTRGSETDPAKVDVLFIVDKSSSMGNNNSSRLANAKAAMKTMVSSLEGNSNIDARYSIVTFSGPSTTGNSNGKKDASVHMNWTAVNGNNVSNSIDGISSSGGTNYQAGLDVGTDQLGYAREGAITVVIFLSDGEPTWSYKYGNGKGSLGRDSEGWKETLNQAEKMSCDYFYAISVGSDASNYMKDLVNTVKATTKQSIEANSDGSNLTNLFEDIAGAVTVFAASDVTITDELSEYADLVLDANDNPQFTITVTRAAYTDSSGTEHIEETWETKSPVGNNGTLIFQDANGEEVTLTASYDDETRTITLKFLPEDYELEEGYTYSISTVITTATAAEEYLEQNGNEYPHTGDDNTGAHSGVKGFFSNGEAKVTFTANGEEGSTDFPKPVIQVQTSSSTTVSSLPLTGGEFTPLMLLLSGTALAIIGASIWLLSRRRLV